MNKKKKFLLLCASKKSALPAGYTALEYLETSGTQYIVAQHLFATNNDKASGAFDVSSSIEGTQVVFGSRKAWRQQALAVAVSSNDVSYAQFATQTNSFDFEHFFNTKTALEISQAGFYINGQWISAFSYATFTSIYPYYLFTTRNDSILDARMMVGKCYAFSVERSGVLMLRLIPALRDSDGEPGMFDTVSKQFFINSGTGVFGYRIKRTGEIVSPMSLRDPYRVAPSGVYARKVSETELEIIADTEEASGDGWEWFANTGEAYEHFGIIMSEQI